MASSSLLPNYALNKLATPRLDVVNPDPSTNIEGLTPNYLYSIVTKLIINNQNLNQGQFIFNKSDLQIIEFTDRPFRQSGPFNTQDFIDLFKNGNTFETDPPNAVLTFPKQDGVTSSEQIVVEMSLENETDTTVTFNFNITEFLAVDSILLKINDITATNEIDISIFVDTTTNSDLTTL